MKTHLLRWMTPHSPIWRCFAVAGLLIFGSGCRTAPQQSNRIGLAAVGAAALNTVNFTNHVDPAWLQPPDKLFTLGPGDKLEIELIGEPLSRTATVVGPDGKIYFELLSGIDVWGLTIAQARAQMEGELAKYVRRPPQISLVLRGVESKRIWVLGCVQAPGLYVMAAPMTLLEAISMAGGAMSLTSFRDQAAAGLNVELADLRHSFVIRQGKLLPVDFHRLYDEGDLSQNIYLQPDDFIYFPSATAGDVYVLGAVTQPQPVPYSENLTVAGAIASSFGTIKGAYLHHVAVVRGSMSQPQITIVDYKAVLRGEAPDLALQPRDIVYVPFSPYRYLQHYAEVILNSFVSASAINAGSAAVTKQTTGGAGVFIPVGSGIQTAPPASVPPVSQ
jgi:protein involved in polysaccharide export with SLBB domain